MANKQLFSSSRGRTVKPATAKNAAGGKAYEMGAKEALARYAATGCLSNTYYVKAEDHLDRVLELAKKCDPEFIAKLAVYARKEGFMKDMPALLVAYLAAQKSPFAKPAFALAIDNGRMLRNFVQIMRSGKLGRKSLGSGPRNMVRGFLTSNSPAKIFRQLSVGQTPSGADIIKMVHPKGDAVHDALFGYMIGKVKPETEKFDLLPWVVKNFELWKANRDIAEIPQVPFELLTAQPLNKEQWKRIFQHGGWHFVRMNLNTAVRHGVLEELKDFVAEKLRDREEILRSRVMPYQLLAAYKHIDHSKVPRKVINALHDALEISVENVPALKGNTFVIVDVSGSMRSPVTGYSYGRGSSPASKVRCVDAAALLASAIVRRNEDTIVLPVDTRLHTDFKPEPRNTIMTEAERLARFGGGGTALSIGLQAIHQCPHKVSNVVIVSDQESWADGSWYWGHRGPGTTCMHEWEAIRSKNPGAKLVCIDIVAGRTHQFDLHPEMLHVAGWNDSVFKVMASFLNGDVESWLKVVEAIPLTPED